MSVLSSQGQQKCSNQSIHQDSALIAQVTLVDMWIHVLNSFSCCKMEKPGLDFSISAVILPSHPAPPASPSQPCPQGPQTLTPSQTPLVRISPSSLGGVCV